MMIGVIRLHMLLRTSLLNRWSSRMDSVLDAILRIAGITNLRQSLSMMNAPNIIPAMIAIFSIMTRLPSAKMFFSVSIYSNSCMQI